MKYLITLLLFTQVALAQYNTKFQDPKSPDAYLFEKYGNVPVSKYSGRPDITIPLHTIQEGDLTIPLNLTYNSNGIRVDEEASQVGLGWYFGTGMISQIKQGKDDLKADSDLKLPDYFWNSSQSYVIDPYPGWRNRFLNEPLPTDPARRILNTSTPQLDQYFMARLRSDGGYSNMTYFSHGGQLFTDYSAALNFPHMPMDMELDLFKANFFGHDLIFYINPYASSWENKFQVLNNEKYKISVQQFEDYSSFSWMRYAWTIIAPDGISYIFEEQLETAYSSDRELFSSTIETPGTGYKTYTPSGPNIGIFEPFNYSRVWKITKIIDAKGNEILFNYEKLQQKILSVSGSTGRCEFLNIAGTRMFINDNQHQLRELEGPTFQNSSSGFSQIFGTGLHFARFYTNTLAKHEKSVLKEILYSSSKVQFTYGDRIDIPFDKKLTNVKIFHKLNEVKSIDFSYDYFVPASSEDTQKRLKLLSLNFGDKPYLFTYNPTTLPVKDSNSFDFWGYYNGLPNTTSINNPFRIKNIYTAETPVWAKFFRQTLDGKANRSAVLNACKAGILEKINYPTGGHTALEYELNDFGYSQSDPQGYFFPDANNKTGINSALNYINDYAQTKCSGFGLRIKSVTDSPDDIILYKKRYTYTGGKHITPYIFSSDESHNTLTAYCEVNGGAIGTRKTYSDGLKIVSHNSSLYQTSMLGNGEGIGYDSVTVEDVAQNGATLGKTVSFYTNIPDFSARTKFGFGISYALLDMYGSSVRQTDVDNGLLIKEEIYDNNSKLRLDEYEYEQIMHKNDLCYNVKVVRVPGQFMHQVVCQNMYFYEYLIFYYPLKKAINRLKNKKSTEYFSSGSIGTSTSYSYDSNYIPTGKVVVDASDLPGGNAMGTEISEMDNSYILTEKNIFTYPKKTTFSKYGYTQKIINYNYKETVNSNGQNHYVCMVSDWQEEILKGSTTGNGKKVIYDRYDEKNNLVEWHETDGIYTVVVLGYNKKLPIAKIVNATFTQVSGMIANVQNISNGADPDAFESSLITALAQIRSALPNAQVTTYTHKPSRGISSITDPKSMTTYYTYDNRGRLKFIKDASGNILTENQYHFKD